MISLFDQQKAVHVILFVLHSLGKQSDPLRLFLLLYLADVKHLAKHGSLIFGDTYIAMKYGPVPFHVLGIYKRYKDERDQKAGPAKLKKVTGNSDHFNVNADGELVAKQMYNIAFLSETEVNCLFEILQRYKNQPTELLATHAMANAWKNANINGEISTADMTTDGFATFN